MSLGTKIRNAVAKNVPWCVSPSDALHKRDDSEELGGTETSFVFFVHCQAQDWERVPGDRIQIEAKFQGKKTDLQR